MVCVPAESLSLFSLFNPYLSIAMILRSQSRYLVNLYASLVLHARGLLSNFRILGSGKDPPQEYESRVIGFFSRVKRVKSDDNSRRTTPGEVSSNRSTCHVNERHVSALTRCGLQLVPTALLLAEKRSLPDLSCLISFGLLSHLVRRTQGASSPLSPLPASFPRRPPPRAN